MNATTVYKPLPLLSESNKGLVEKKQRTIDVGNMCEWCNKEKRTFKALCYECDKSRTKPNKVPQKKKRSVRSR